MTLQNITTTLGWGCRRLAKYLKCSPAWAALLISGAKEPNDAMKPKLKALEKAARKVRRAMKGVEG